jgi:nucleotide-binding universal stress UspA family protein
MPAHPRKIVVGYDGSDAAGRALDAAAALAGYGSTLSVVTVGRREGRNGGERTAVLDGARERLLSRHETANYLAPVGDPAEQLIETARELDADLLVVGRRDQGALQRLVLGSVSSKVVGGAPCDVLVVR